MAKPFNEQINIQPQTISTGQPQLLMSLGEKLDSFASQTAGIAARKQVESATIEGQQAGIAQQKTGKPLALKEENFIGGISSKAFNSAAREGYLKSLDNDIMESFSTLASENSGDLQGYNTGAEALSKGFMNGADPASRSAVELSIDSMVSRHRPKIQAAQAKAIVDQGNEDQAINAEERGRLAQSSAFEGDAEQADINLGIAIDSINNRTDLDDVQKSKAIRNAQLKERESALSGKLSRTYDTDGSQAAMSELDSMKAPKWFTPDEWDSFSANAQSDINRRIARQKATTSIDLAEGGKKLKEYGIAKSLGFDVNQEDEAGLNQLIETSPELVKGKKLIDDTAQFSVMSFSDRQDVLSAAQTGRLEDVAQFASAMKADQQINKAAIEDGYSLGVKQGIVEQVPLDIGNAESFKARLDQAELLTNHYNVDVSPLSDSEATALSDSIVDMTTQEKMELATTLQASPSVWGQLDKKNAGQFAMAGATGDFTAMSAVFKGQELLAQKLVKPLKQDDYLSDFNDMVEGVYGPGDRKAILDAAISHYSSTSSSAIDGSLDSGDFEASVMAVTGGIAKLNGFNVELPRGVTDDSFEEFIDNIQPETIEDMGGIANYADLDAVNAIQNGRIRSIGSNKYMVETNGGTLFGNDGKPFIFSYSLDIATTNTALAHSRSFARRKELRSQ